MSRTNTPMRKRIILALATVVTITGAGVAYAYWTSTGTGIGEATTDTSVPFEITSEAAVGTIAPGSAGETVAFTVTNPGEGTQNLALVTVALADEAGIAWVPTGTCLATDYVVTVSTAPAYGPIAPDGEVGGVATVTLNNTGISQDDCKGQVIPLYFVAS